jgi:hypothetical protein
LFPHVGQKLNSSRTTWPQRLHLFVAGGTARVAVGGPWRYVEIGGGGGIGGGVFRGRKPITKSTAAKIRKTNPSCNRILSCDVYVR